MRRIHRIVMTAILTSASAASWAAENPIDVWLDVDPAAGLFERDVDDAVAMIQAFHSPELRIHGVSIVYGNAPLDKGLPIAKEVVRRFGPAGLEVYSGAASSDNLGEDTEAIQALATQLSQRPMTILALGPLTNIGSLLQRHPEIHDRIQSIVIVAGRRPNQKFNYRPEDTFSFPDFNFENDPKAMQIILDSEIEVVLTPWEVSSHLWIKQKDLETLRNASETGAYIAEKSKSWINMWKRQFDFDGFNPFDTLGVAWVTHPELIESFLGAARIETAPNDREGPREPAEKAYLLIEEGKLDGRTVRYCYRPKPELKSILLERLSNP